MLAIKDQTHLKQTFTVRRLQEFVRYDSRFLHAPLAYAGLAGGTLLRNLSAVDWAFDLLTKTHSSAFSDRVADLITQQMRSDISRSRDGQVTSLDEACRRYVESYSRRGNVPARLQDPRRMLGSRIIVLKSPRSHERGVILLGYSYVFPLFAKLFDVEAIARRYHIVLEPSWCGLCALDLLCFTLYDFPIFVESWEPRDTRFLERLGSNLVPVPIADNWWVDYRIVKPHPSIPKDIDVIMVAAWATFKRHWRFFEVLKRLRDEGERPKVLLVGYPVDSTKEAIASDARFFGVLDQLEIHESVSVEQVVQMLARSKVHVLWSRREGANRAHVEAMFCNLPVVLREGYNFGYRQPHVNPSTGVYANEANLGGELRRLLESYRALSPRDWVMAHMTCQKATDILAGHIQTKALSLGERWTEGLAVKTVMLNTQNYWDPEDRRRFEPDYGFLESHIRR